MFKSPIEETISKISIIQYYSYKFEIQFISSLISQSDTYTIILCDVYLLVLYFDLF